MPNTTSDTWKTKTKLVHAGTRRSQYGEVSEAIFLTQGFVYDNAEAAEARFIKTGDDEFIYARYGNPTVRMFEERIAALEGAEDAFATASGMAAVNGALFSALKAGDHVVSAKALFGSCLYIIETLLPRFGVEVTFVDGTDLDAWRAAVRPDTKLCFLEALSNPTLEVIDIAGVAKITHKNNALLMVDNVFATPIFQRTLTLGADVVIYSATKHIDGQGRCLGGVVLGSREFIRKTLEPYLKHTGGALSPFSAWVMLKGLETLDLRCNAQADAALTLAQALEGHPKLTRTIYPSLASHPQQALAARQMTKGGTVLSLDIKGGRDGAFRFLNALQIILISNNLGDAKSLVTHPATTTHQRLTIEQRQVLGIGDGLVRVSIGLEDVDDLLADILDALDSA
ncbi:MAG: O-succinylhomoserine sulfhydrylase [Rhodobacterales bacterium]|jgi:O-succinylhomoserine sulfhydrylase|nr:O-succinylhomoserine sulfhydrylase [Pseudomonadota bacterium]MDA1285994.1 O-succinylhomoserine sulfhydrylase [Pseudomonadota bacterium]NQW15439.1 O-succinylhomoserine sulfhydrylase [Rhodobacter sp.]HBN32064.1 O-succinylhomoserine sulfhydrylase [Paracoccaceae bacterium]